MSPRRASRYDKRDTNEAEIVASLLQIPGISVEQGHDDIIVGRRGVNYWFEIKNPAELTKSGRLKKNKTRTYEKQQKLLSTWCGHYEIVTTLDQILISIGVIK